LSAIRSTRRADSAVAATVPAACGYPPSVADVLCWRRPRAARRRPTWPARGRRQTVCVSCASLRGDDEVGAAILRERRFVMTRIKREFLAVADRAQPIGGNAQRNQIRARGTRATLAQRQIVLGCAAVVAVTFDRHGPAAIPFQQCRVVVQNLLAVA